MRKANLRTRKAHRSNGHVGGTFCPCVLPSNMQHLLPQRSRRLVILIRCPLYYCHSFRLPPVPAGRRLVTHFDKFVAATAIFRILDSSNTMLSFASAAGVLFDRQRLALDRWISLMIPHTVSDARDVYHAVPLLLIKKRILLGICQIFR